MRPARLLLVLPFFLLACSGSDDDDDNTMSPRDGGVVARDGGPAPRDAGPARDGGPAVCDPVANTGCMSPNECLYHINLLAPQCRLPGMNTHEQECDPNAQDCPGGYTCLFLMGDPNPSCRKVCRLSDGTGCENLTGMGMSYRCGIAIMDEAEFGWCSACANTCDPLAPNCAMNQTCSLDATCGTVCAAAGSAPLNAACENDRCRAPGMCVGITDVNMGQRRCYEPCDTNNPQCMTMGYQCANIGEAFGLCIPM